MRTKAGGPPAHRRFLVLGGGPAGSTAAAMLAREGLEVCLLERETFPRYHIGESLIASVIPVLRFIGAEEKVARHGFVEKFGAYFTLKQGLPPGYVDFGSRGPVRHSYQVIRSEFDDLLLQHAADEGAEVYEDVAVREVRFDGDAPVEVTHVHGATGAVGATRFDYVLDATGLSGLLSTKYLHNRVHQEQFAHVAIGRYWRGFSPFDEAQPGAFFCEAVCDGRGWLWTIPLHDGTISVGAVIHRDTLAALRTRLRDLEAVLADCIEGCPVVSRMLRDATPTAPARTWQDYSYVASSFAGERYRLLGDAAGFIDPLFSTGVHMAMLGALSAVASLASVARGEVTEARAARFHDQFVRRAFVRFVILVAGAYRQIRDPSQFVLFGGNPLASDYLAQVPEVDAELFRLAFRRMQPILSGNLDLAQDKAPREWVSEAMDLIAGAALEESGFDTRSNVRKLLAWRGPQSTHDVDELVGRKDPIDGLRIRMERGALGLADAGAAAP